MFQYKGKEISKSVRGHIALDAQDAIHYFIAAGGEVLDEKYGESAFASSYRGDTLRMRLEFLEEGKKKLLDITTEVRAITGKSAYPHWVDEQIFDPRTEKELEEAARRGAKMVLSICDMLMIDAFQGKRIAEKVVDEWEPSRWKEVREKHAKGIYKRR